MSEYIHFVVGIFASHTEVEEVYSKLARLGLPRKQMRIFGKDRGPPQTVTQAASNAVLDDVLIDGAIGTAVGAGIGIAGEVALVAANVTLFVASPLIAPLVMLGWGAGLGGLIGAAAGAMVGAPPSGEAAKQRLAELVSDAVASGQVVLLVETRTAQETTLASDAIRASTGDETDIKIG